MMPSACTKPDQKPSPEVDTPLKKCKDIVDKKVRNLEKKKGKLDVYRSKAEAGEDLNDDQKAAVSNYETVLQTLDFARDLQKSFNQVSNEADKLLKKAARREKLERQQYEVHRIRELLQLQSLLDSMGTENVRSDFLSGKNGAAELAEDNLKQLDEFYKLISPTREGETSFESQVSSASEHIANYLDVKDKEVAGTTYKDLRSVVDRIKGCSYFDGSKKQMVEEVQETTVEETPVTAESSETSAAPVAADVAGSDEDEEPVAGPKDDDSNAQAFENAQSEYYASDAGQFSRQPRPFQEIVSSVQGSFNFLQDSEIEVDGGAGAHIDPAVVAAHPIADPTYQNAGLLSNPSDPASYSQQTLAQDPASAQAEALTADSQSQFLDQSAATTTSQTGFDASAYTTEQGFNPNLISQSLVSTTTPHSFVDQSSSLAVQMSQMDMSGSAAVPQPIPMPTQGLQGENFNTQAAPESSTFTMNPNANVFRSIYHQEESLPADGQTVSAGGYTQENKSFSSAIQNDFQGSGNFDGSAGGFGNKQGGYQRVSGSRDMGGNRGRGGMSNGYRGNQQGRGGQSGNYRGRGGNYSNGNPGRGRGGSTYSGYPPRGDYRPDGYQGFSSSFTPGFSGGKPRGSARGTGDGPRRGPPRGGNGGMNRGGGRGGYGRSNMQQGQAAGAQ